MGVTSSVSPKFLSAASTPTAQPPILPLPPLSGKLQYTTQFTEEFDFQAMNEKFKKDEVWVYLGKANQRDKVEGMQKSGTSSQNRGDDNAAWYSRVSPRNGQNRFSDGTFGNFQWGTQLVYGGHRAGRGEHHGPYWGRGYNYGNRGHGGYKQR